MAFLDRTPKPSAPVVSSELLASIKPTPSREISPAAVVASDLAAQSVGFISREAPTPSTSVPEPPQFQLAVPAAKPRRKVRKPAEERSMLTLRVKLSIHEKFNSFADALQVSNPDFLEILLKHYEATNGKS